MWVEILNDAKDEFENDGATAVFSTWRMESEDPFDVGDIEIVDGMHARAGRLALDARMTGERAARLLAALQEGEFLLILKSLLGGTKTTGLSKTSLTQSVLRGKRGRASLRSLGPQSLVN